MGRDRTGAWTVHESTRLDLTWLLKNGYIRKNCTVSAILSWTNNWGKQTAVIGFRSSYLPNTGENHVELSYTVTKGTGEKKDYKYRIQLVEVPSNLGKGKVLYFRCPETGRKCRILYMAYGYPAFKCREAYRNRLYYDSQMASKLSQYNDGYWRIDKYLKKIEGVSCNGRRVFKGRLTKAAQRYNRLWHKQCKLDELRWTLGAPKSIRGMLQKAGLF